MTWSAVVGFVILSALVPFVWETPNLNQVAIGAAIGFISTAGHWIVTIAYRHAPASTLVPFSYSQIIWAGLLGFTFFGTVPTAWMGLGVLVICGSGLYTAHRERMRRVPARPGCCRRAGCADATPSNSLQPGIHQAADRIGRLNFTGAFHRHALRSPIDGRAMQPDNRRRRADRLSSAEERREVRHRPACNVLHVRRPVRGLPCDAVRQFGSRHRSPGGGTGRMVVPLVLPPVETHVAGGPRFGWLVCAQAGPSLAIRDGLPFLRLPGGHGDLVLVVLLAIPTVAVTLVTARSLFTRAEMDAAIKRGSRNGQVAQARRAPPA